MNAKNSNELLFLLKVQGITLYRTAAGALRARPSQLLTDEIRAALRTHRDALEMRFPPESIEDHIPADLRRPCMSPRLIGDLRCRAFTQDDLACHPGEFEAKRRAAAKLSKDTGCGDCDLVCHAHSAAKLREQEAARRARISQKEERFKRYFPERGDQSHDEEDEESEE